MVNWEDSEYINPYKKVFKNLDTGEILNLELQADPENIEKQSKTPINAHNLNKAQELAENYTGTTITAPTVAGMGRIEKVCGTADGVGTLENGRYKIEVISKSGEQQSSNVCYLQSPLFAGDMLDYKKKKVVRVDGTEEDVDCTDKIVQYAGETTVTCTDNAEIEVTLSNNKAIAEINRNIAQIEENMKFQIQTNKEIATDRYIGGKRVYVRYFEIGSLPNTSAKQVLTPIATTCRVVELKRNSTK